MACADLSTVLCRVYDGFCGEMVWESEEHEGRDVQLLAPPSSCSCIGIHDSSGVWVLRSRRLSEHTQVVSQALFPITTNADEVCTSPCTNSYDCSLSSDYTRRLSGRGEGTGCCRLLSVGPEATCLQVCTGGPTRYSPGNITITCEGLWHRPPCIER